MTTKDVTLVESHEQGKTLVLFSAPEWEIIKGCIEDSLAFYAATMEIFDEHPADFPLELGTSLNKDKLKSDMGQRALTKLEQIGVDIKGLI